MADIWDLGEKLSGRRANDVWSLGAPIGGTPAPTKQVNDIGSAILSGLQGSSMGLIVRGKLPDIDLAADAPWQQRLAHGVGGVVGDIIPGIAGSYVGGAAGAGAGSAVPALGTATGGALGSFAGAFAAPMAIREALIDAYTNNYAGSWEGVWEIAKSAMKGGAKGAVIGVATGGAARIAGNIAAPAAGSAVLAGNLSARGARLSTDAATLTAELTALTASASAIEGHMPTWQHFMDNALLLGGAKGAMKLSKSLFSTYAETGKHPDVVAGEAKIDPTIALDLKPVEGASGRPDVVTVYHGSPHVFEKFDTSKIGTGEGAQAFGHGLYFAENPKVSGDYASKLSAPSSPTNDIARNYLDAAGGDIAKAVRALKDYTGYDTQGVYAPSAKYRAELDDVIRAINGLPGQHYRVEIPKSVVEGMLDWDKPLSEQPANVQAAIAKLHGVTPEQYAEMMRLDPDKFNKTGKQLHADMARRKAPTVALFPGSSAEYAHPVAESLRAAGIPGIKYLDQGSRGKGEGTRNYVLFDAEHARIVERNGQPVGSTETPRAYQPLAQAERVKAALDGVDMKELAAAVADSATGRTPFDVKRAPIAHEYIIDVETAKAVMRAIADASKDNIENQKRDVVRDVDALAEARAVLERGDLERQERGTPDSVELSLARAFMVRGATDRLRALATEFDNTPPTRRTLEQEVQLHGAMEQVAMYLSEYGAGVSEGARTVRMAGVIKRNPEMLGDAQALVEAYRAAGKDAAKMAEIIRNTDDAAAIAKLVSEAPKATTFEKILELFRANIFSGPLTAGANLIGGLGRLAAESLAKPVSAALTAIERKAAGDPLTLAQFNARAFAPTIGFVLGIKDGIVGAGQVLRGQQVHADKVELNRVANEGVLGLYTKTVFSSLQAGDMLFRVPAERAKAYIMAVDRVVKEGRHPDTAEARAEIMKYTRDPTLGLSETRAAEVMAEITQAGAEAVFSQRLGPKFEKVQNVIAGTPLQLLVPAFRTPVNLASYAAQSIPGINFMSARWRADFAAGGEVRAQAVARVMIGAGLMTWAYSLFSNDQLTGGGLFDREMSGAKVGAGKQPYSFKVGNTYYGIERLEPIAKPIMLAADIMEMLNSPKLKEEDAAKLTFMGIMALGNITISTTYLSSLSNFMKALDQPDRYLTNFLESYGAAVVPKAIGQTVQLSDPYKREVDGVLEAAQSQLPWLREKLLPKVDVWGENVQQGKLFSVLPIAKTTATDEKVKSEALRLSFAIADAPRFVQEKGPFKERERQTKLNPEQRNEFKGASGRFALEVLGPIVNNPDWDRLPDYVQAAQYQRIFEAARKVGEQASAPKDSDARQKVRDKIIEDINRQTVQAETGTKPEKRITFGRSGERQ